MFHTGESRGVTLIVCEQTGAAETDTEALVIAPADMPISPRTSDRMLATALRSPPCGAKVPAVGGCPPGFKNDRRFNRLKVNVFGGC